MGTYRGPIEKRQNGRPKGALNRSTEQMKLTISRAINNTLTHLNEDLEKIRKDNPAKAAELAIKLMEYTLPKLKSVDINGSMDVNAKIQQISVNIMNGTNERTEN
jgi:hypothetical protein